MRRGIEWVPSQSELSEIKRLSNLGLADYEIADFLSVHKGTFCTKKADFPEIREALATGLAEGVAQRLECLKFLGEKSPLANIFWLTNRNRERWAVRTETDNTNREIGQGVFTPEWLAAQPPHVQSAFAVALAHFAAAGPAPSLPSLPPGSLPNDLPPQTPKDVSNE